MKQSFSLKVCLLAVSAARVAAAEQPVLPEQFGTWSKDSCANQPAQSVLAPEAGALGSIRCSFKSGSDSISVSLEKYRDPSSAYEIYTSVLSPSMQPSSVGGPSAFDGEKFVTLIGNYVLEVLPPTKITKAELDQLVKIASRAADRSPLPPKICAWSHGF
jgi:hypothetical protein